MEINISDRELFRLYFLAATIAVGGGLFLFLYPCPYLFKVLVIGFLIIGVKYSRKAYATWRFFKGLKELKILHLLPSKVPTKKDNIYLGRGFMWDSEQTKMMHALSQEPIEKYLHNNEEMGGRSILHGVGSNKEADVFLPISEFTGHLSLMGATRVGKTRFLECLLKQIINRGDSLIVIDPKGERRLLDFCYSQAIKQEREKDFVLFSPPLPQISKTYNPLADYVSITDIADRIVAILPQGGESQAFTNFCHNIVLAISKGLEEVGEPITLEKIEQYAFSTRQADELLARVLKKFLNKRMGKNFPDIDEPKEWVERYNRTLKEAKEKGIPIPDNKACEDLIGFYRHPRENFLKMSNELKPLLARFNAGEYRRLLSSKPSDISWKRMLNKGGKIVYFYLGSLVGLTTAYSIGQLVLQDLISYVGRRYVYSEKSNPIWLVIDEFHNVCYPGFVDLISKAGGANLRVIISMQSLADLEANMRWAARAHAQQILDNTATKVCMQVADSYTADRFTSITGITSVETKAESAYVTPEVDDSQEVFDTSYRTTTAKKEIALIQPTWLNELPKGQAFMYHQGKAYKLKFPLFPEPERNFFKEHSL